MKTLYIGIDPGQSGGFCTIKIKADGNLVTEAYKMPDTEHDANIILQKACYGVPSTSTLAMLEKVGAMPGQGVSSMFKFGKNYGFLRGLLIANMIPFLDVPPRTWQKGLSIQPRGKEESKTHFKNRQKGLAQQMHPHLKVTLATADAILIAEYLKKYDND